MLNNVKKIIGFGAGFIGWTVVYPLLHSENGQKILVRAALTSLKKHPELLENARMVISAVIAEDTLSEAMAQAGKSQEASTFTSADKEPAPKAPPPPSPPKSVRRMTEDLRAHRRNQEAVPGGVRDISGLRERLGLKNKPRNGAGNGQRPSKIHDDIDRLNAGNLDPSLGGSFGHGDKPEDETSPSVDPLETERSTTSPEDAQPAKSRNPYFPALDGNDKPDEAA